MAATKLWAVLATIGYSKRRLRGLLAEGPRKSVIMEHLVVIMELLADIAEQPQPEVLRDGGLQLLASVAGASYVAATTPSAPCVLEDAPIVKSEVRVAGPTPTSKDKGVKKDVGSNDLKYVDVDVNLKCNDAKTREERDRCRYAQPSTSALGSSGTFVLNTEDKAAGPPGRGTNTGDARRLVVMPEVLPGETHAEYLERSRLLAAALGPSEGGRALTAYLKQHVRLGKDP